MDEQNQASSDQNTSASSGKLDPKENHYIATNSDGNELASSTEALVSTNPYSADTDRDRVNDLQPAVLETDPNSLDTNSNSIAEPKEKGRGTQPSSVEEIEESSQQIEGIQSFTQEPDSRSLDTELGAGLQPLDQLSNLKSDISSKNSLETEQLSFADTLYQRLRERSNLDVGNISLSVYEGIKVLYEGNLQAVKLNKLTPEHQNLLEKTLDDPTGLKGELKIDVNGETIFHVADGKLKIDSYGLAYKQQLPSLQPSKQAQAISSPLAFNPPAAYNRYQQQSQAESTVPTAPASIGAYERIAQKALSDGLHVEQVKQVLKEGPFHQTLALSLGEEDASRLTDHLLNSLADQAKTNSLSSIANTDNPVAALESRVKNLESFNQHLSSQVEILSQKLEKLGQSKAFWSHSHGLNQFLGNVRDYVANTWLAARNSLRQKAGEVSLALVGTLALASTERFGEPTRGGNRVIDAGNGKRLSINREGDIKIGLSPQLQPASEYQRLLQGIDPKLPPSLLAKQIATSALKEKFTTPQIQSILSQSPKFKEIASKQGADKALQFVNVTLAAASRQNAIESQPQPQRSLHQQSQHQA